MKLIIRNFFRLFQRFRVAMSLNILGLSVAVCAVTQGLYLATSHWFGHDNSIHIEVLLPAFVVGMLMKHRHIDTADERRVATGISFFFMLLVGLSMPLVTGAGTSGGAEAAASVTGLASTET